VEGNNLVRKPANQKAHFIQNHALQKYLLEMYLAYKTAVIACRTPCLIADFTGNVTFFVAPSLNALSMSKL
jgi:hypothetical protein